MTNKFSIFTLAALIATTTLAGYGQQFSTNDPNFVPPADYPNSGGSVATKTAGIYDPTMGGIRFTTIVVPADWFFQGAMTQATGCSVITFPFYRAASPDGLSGVKLFPPVEFAWTDNPGAPSRPDSGCIPRVGEINAADYMQYVIRELNVGFVKDTTDPAAVQATRNDIQPFISQQPGRVRTYFKDRASSLVTFNINSIKEMETIEVTTACNVQGGFRGFYNYYCTATVQTTWAPEGKLYATTQMLHSVIKRTDNPGWEQAWIQRNNAQWDAYRANATAQINTFYSNLRQQTISSGENFRAQQDSRFATHEAQIANMRQNGDNNLAQQQQRWNSQSQHTGDRVDSILNQQKRYDPNTGQEFKTDRGSTFNWVSADGKSYYPTNDISDNPNGRLNGTWTLAQNLN